MAVDDKDLEEANDLSVAPIVGPDDPRRFTDTGIEIQPIYTADDVPDDLDERLGDPGEYPFTRGVHREMYRKQLWTMRQYAGYASAKESNERYRYLLKNGGTGLSMAFDLPTQLGLDSDDPRCLGEVGRTGVAIDSLDDMRTAFDGIPLDEVTTSMTINAPAAVLLLLYQLVGEEQGVDPEKLRGTTQNDILKEYIARGNFIYPPEPSMRLVTDLFAYCAEHDPEVEHRVDLRLPLPREGLQRGAGGRVHARQRHGLRAGGARRRARASTTSPPASPSSSTATTTSSRRSRSSAPPASCGPSSCATASAPQSPKSQTMRFHTQTGGVTLTAQQPANNIVRVALQGFAAVGGGTQSLHTNGYDEALALPSERAAKIALRTQQIIAHESGAADTVDPFAGSYYVEALTKEIEDRSRALIEKIDEMGGSVNAIAFIKSEIEESAFGYHERYRTKQDIVVGVNKYEEEDVEVEDILRVDPESEREQVERLKAFKESRDQEQATKRLEELREAARGDENLLPADPRRPQGLVLDRRGLRRDARGVRRVPARDREGGRAPRDRDRPGPRGQGLVRAQPPRRELGDDARRRHLGRLPGGGRRAADRARRARAAARRGARPLPRRGQPGGLPRARRRVHPRGRGRGAAAEAVGLLPLPARDGPHHDRRRRRAVRDLHARRPQRRAPIHYSPDPVAAKYGAAVKEPADSSREAYADQDRTYTPVKAPWPGT